MTAIKLFTVLTLAASFAVSAQTNVLPEWTFATDGNYQGCIFNEHLVGSIVKDGALVGLTSGGDPYILSPAINVPASEVSRVVVRMKLQGAEGELVSNPGEGRLYWTTTTETDCADEASVRIITFQRHMCGPRQTQPEIEA